MHELTINLRPSDKEPLYEQIYTYIKDEIRAGRILCKEKLPSTRALSSYLEVSRSTVELAYEQLLSEGQRAGAASHSCRPETGAPFSVTVSSARTISSRKG